MGKVIDGWDSARMVWTKRTNHPKAVTFVYPYYDNPVFLKKQIMGWNRFPENLRSHLSAIIVDDCSSLPAEDVIRNVEKPFAISLYRIDVDLPWNWIAAKNVGMHHALETWCVGTDIDHVITNEVAESLVWDNHDPAFIYRFSRAEHTGEKLRPHPNSWFMTREMFWKFGGYDENFSGHYGTDGDARRRWAKTAPVLTLSEKLIRYEYHKDSSTTKYKRKTIEDRVAVANIIASRGKEWKPKVLSFPYHQVL